MIKQIYLYICLLVFNSVYIVYIICMFNLFYFAIFTLYPFSSTGFVFNVLPYIYRPK